MTDITPVTAKLDTGAETTTFGRFVGDTGVLEHAAIFSSLTGMPTEFCDVTHSDGSIRRIDFGSKWTPNGSDFGVEILPGTTDCEGVGEGNRMIDYQAAKRALVRVLKMHTDLTALEIREVAEHSHKVVDAALRDDRLES
jgi:hypothetical protein